MEPRNNLEAVAGRLIGVLFKIELAMDVSYQLVCTRFPALNVLYGKPSFIQII